MSRHTIEIVPEGKSRTIRITTGWDRALSGFFLEILSNGRRVFAGFSEISFPGDFSVYDQEFVKRKISLPQIIRGRVDRRWR